MKTKTVRKRPEKALSEVTAEARGSSKKKSLYDKQFTAIKAPGDDGSVGGIFVPTEDQLEKINCFTRSPKTADEVVCFRTLSCNDMIDRDLDQFTPDCIEDFAKLPGELSPVGKSYMISHDYTKLPVGRIFDVDTTTIDSVKFLTNDVFMPNTEQYKDFIENIDFGIYWAVSVGVMLEETACSVCDSPMLTSRFFGMSWCMDNGHEKGLYYDPNSEEEDDWGWALPVEEGSKGAVLCWQKLFAPKDFYELSQCFLGAQYGAQLERSMKGVLKAASAQKVPFLNLGAQEAKELPLQHINEQVADAYRKGFAVKHDDDGTLTWKDESNLVWAFDPFESEVLCLGESNEEKEVTDAEGSEDESQDGTAQRSAEEVGSEDADGSSDANEPEGDATADSSGQEPVEASASNDNEEDEERVEDKQVVAAALKAKLPASIIERATAAQSGSALSVLLEETAKHINDIDSELRKSRKQAELGEEFVKAKKSEALKWYVKNRQTGENKGVDTSMFQKMLDRFGDDIELIDEVIQEQKDLAQAKFPASVRRSAEPGDPNSRNELQESKLDDEAAAKLRKLHG